MPPGRRPFRHGLGEYLAVVAVLAAAAALAV